MDACASGEHCRRAATSGARQMCGSGLVPCLLCRGGGWWRSPGPREAAEAGQCWLPQKQQVSYRSSRTQVGLPSVASGGDAVDPDPGVGVVLECSGSGGSGGGPLVLGVETPCDLTQVTTSFWGAIFLLSNRGWVPPLVDSLIKDVAPERARGSGIQITVAGISEPLSICQNFAPVS